MSPKLTQKQKFSKKTFGFFKFTAIFIMVAVLVFSNLAPSALKYFGAEKLAEHTRIKEAQAQVANDAASESHTGTTGSASEASFSWTHTPVGTPRGVLVFVTTISATKIVTSVTYGGVAMTEITAGVAIDTVTEPGRIDTFFLGSSVPTGAQTVTVNRTNNTVVMYAVAATVTAGGNTEVYTPGIVLLQENGPLAEQLVTDGSPGVNSVRYAVGYSGTAAVLAAGANSTVLNSIDFGVFTSNFARETIAGQGSRSVGFSEALDDDRAAIHLAVREVIPPDTITVGTAGTQTATMAIPSSNSNVGGAFTFARSTGSADVTQIIITDIGTVNANLNLSNVDILYKIEATCSASIPVDAALFGTGTSFNASEKATVSGTMAVGTSQICVYVRLDVSDGATSGQTLEIEISNPSTEVTVSAGSVLPATAIAIAGTTILSGAVFTSFGMPYLHTSANWGSGVTFYFEVYMRATTGTAYARLFNETDGTAVAGSVISTASVTFVRLRTAPVTLTDGKIYRVQFGKVGADAGEALGAKLIGI